MLWTEKYRPTRLEEICGQEPVTNLLSSFATSGNVPHLMLTGPHGTGKSAAIECFAKKLYGENWEINTSVFQTADLFSQGKKMLEEDERYAHLYQKSQSLIVNFKYILKWYASMRPLDAAFKLMVFEDAHALTRDAQQGLRRIMERYSGTCRFIFSTTNQSAIIPAITSRCLPLFFSPVNTDVISSRLSMIRAQEDGGAFPCSDDDLELIAQAAQGDLRKAILLLQVALQHGQCQDVSGISQSETGTITASALDAIRKGDPRSAILQFESLMIDYGLSAREVLSLVQQITHRDYNHPRLAIAIADADYRVGHCNSEYVQIDAFATGIRDVFV
ncbi:MAG: AAA family ATPase [Methanoregula sp.]|nr:AAA family ATPase [Methanoregula sp.]